MSWLMHVRAVMMALSGQLVSWLMHVRAVMVALSGQLQERCIDWKGAADERASVTLGLVLHTVECVHLRVQQILPTA